jgi:tetratricopeptide (TPR) repeat protein
LKTLLTICALAALSLAACHVDYIITVPVNYAPKLELGRNETKVVLVNRFTVDSLDIKNKRKRGVLKGGVYSAIAIAAKQLDMLPRIKTTILADSVNLTADTTPVKKLAEKYNANYILTLDSLSADIPMTLEDSTEVYNTVVNVKFTLYESNGNYFKVLRGKANDFHSESHYYGLFAALLVHPTIKGNGPAISQSAGNAAIDAIKDYLPSTLTNQRQVYTDNDSLKIAVNHIFAKRYNEAFKILNPLIDGPDLKLASHAAYDLAVLYEAQGDIEEALKAAKLSNQKRQNNYATAIIPALEKE